MSLALNELGRQLGAEMLYFHGNAGFEWLDPTGQLVEMQEVEAVAQPMTLLGLYGYKLQKIQSGTWHKQVASKIAEQLLGRNLNELAQLNKILHETDALNKLDKANRHDDMLAPVLKLTDPTIKKFINTLLDSGAIVQDQSGATALAKKGSGRMLFRSGWFEEYCQDALQKVIRASAKSKAFSEVWAGRLKIDGDNQTAREIDAMFLHGSDLWIVECKAKTGTKGDKLRTAIDQSASLVFQLGGQNTRCMIVYAGDYPTSKATQAELRKTNTVFIHGAHCGPDRIMKSFEIALGLCEPDSFWLDANQSPLKTSSKERKKSKHKPAGRPRNKINAASADK